jgi:hypothetical protein
VGARACRARSRGSLFSGARARSVCTSCLLRARLCARCGRRGWHAASPARGPCKVRMRMSSGPRLAVLASAHVRARVQAAAVCAHDGASSTARLMGWWCIPRAGGAPRLRRPRADLSMRVGPRQKLLIEVPSNTNVHVVAAVKEVPPVDACVCAYACVPARASAC